MATETSGDSNATKSSTTTNKGFCFRPSALSDVADKMWKKSGTETNASSSNAGNAPNLFQLPALSSLSSSSSTGTNSLFTASSTSSSPFIFGKNISNRVANASETDGDSSATAKKETEAPKSEDGTNQKQSQSENGKSDRTGVSFDTLAATSTTTDSVADSSNGGTTVTSSASDTMPGAISEDAAAALEASAAAYEAAKHQTLKQPALLAPEEVKTGEEGEVNVLHAAVKLYVFDAGKQSWTDRGLAIIRVNDRRVTNEEGETLETRIVVRLQGSLRVIVNTKIWPEMLLERVSQKRLRLSGTVALEENEPETTPAISIYLISAGQAADVDRIERLLRDRLARLKEIEHRPSSAAGKKRPFPQPADESSWSNESDQGESSAKKRVEEGNEDK